jgi:hypothetical protein
VYAPVGVLAARLEWLALRGSQIIILAIVVLGLATKMAILSGIPTVQDTAIATMCCLDKETRDSLGSAHGAEGREQQASRIKVKLRFGSCGSLVSLVECKDEKCAE